MRIMVDASVILPAILTPSRASDYALRASAAPPNTLVIADVTAQFVTAIVRHKWPWLGPEIHRFFSLLECEFITTKGAPSIADIAAQTHADILITRCEVLLQANIPGTIIISPARFRQYAQYAPCAPLAQCPLRKP